MISIVGRVNVRCMAGSRGTLAEMRAPALLLLGLLALPVLAGGGFPERQYLCIVDGIDGFADDFPPPDPGDARMACSGTIHYTLRTPTPELLAEVVAALDHAEITGYPIFLTFDDWNFPPDEWNANPGIPEWTDWSGTRCTGRNIEWADDNPQNPPPNFESGEFRAAIEPRLNAVFSAIADRVRAWEEAGEGWRFAGVALGWESGYYTDFTGPSPLRTGFAALTSRGITDADVADAAAARGVGYWEQFDAFMREVVHDYVAWICERARAAGIPRERIYTHFTGVPDDWVPPDAAARDGRLIPFKLAGNRHARPGHTATIEWIDLENLATGAAPRGTPDWGAPEWEATSQRASRDAMLQYLTRVYGHGAFVTVNWGGWWGPFNPYRIDGTAGEQGMKDWLSGNDLAGVGTAVGRSALLGSIDYADSWTEGRAGRVANGSFPVTGAALDVETVESAMARTWSESLWSFRKDGNLFWTPASPDPRGNWAGSRTGITETGGSIDFGIEYGIRDDYIVLFDAVQTDGRVAITSAGARDTTARPDGITVSFRAAGEAVEVGIFNSDVGERDTGFRPGLARNVFHNYGVRFRLGEGELWVYANGRRLGIVDLESFANGAFSDVVWSGAAVTVGASVDQGNRVWTDNVQIGAPCPAVPSVDRLIVRRVGDDVLIDWRIDPAVAYRWRVVEVAGPGLTERKVLAEAEEKRWTDERAALLPGIRYYQVEGMNDCP